MPAPRPAPPLTADAAPPEEGEPPDRIDGPADPLVADLLGRLPEFGPTYLDLVGLFDDDPGAPVIFTELADFVAERLASLDSERAVLDRALAAVEAVAGRGDEEADLIAYAFLDSLSPDDRRLVVPWLGPATRSLLDALDTAGDAPFT
ncbi:MAG: hypothetical protein ACLQOZ_13475 [Acidimicrobiales bacterium]